MIDFHVHSNFSDGKNSPEEVVLSAIDLGLTEIGFSDHGYAKVDEFCFKKGGADYRAEISRLKGVYADKIKILCGVEADYYSELNYADYDYVIGSVHYMQIKGEVYAVDLSAKETRRCVDNAFGGDVFSYAEAYFEMVSKLKDINIVGHIDLLTKFIEKDYKFDTKNPRYVCAYKQAIDELYTDKLAFEINTGAISRGYRTTPYPDTDILEYIVSKGANVILSSDAHSKENLNAQFDLCKQILDSLNVKKAGFFDRKGVYHKQF